jgi:hypothetical protein
LLEVAGAEPWNGTAWAIRQATVPAGASRSFLNRVSCRSASAYTAVGSSTTKINDQGASADQALAEAEP